MSVRPRPDLAEVGRLPKHEAVVIFMDERRWGRRRPPAELRQPCEGVCRGWGAPLGGRP
jgi:hypothetical protein